MIIMKVVIYMAVTANGLIAKENDDTTWISKEEWDSYSLTVRTAGNVVIGHRTYEIITKQPEFAEFKGVKVVVVSKKKFQTLNPSHVVVNSPREALEILRDFENVIVAGGSILNASFLAENLVDEIFLDIEPVIFGKGIKLFTDDDFEAKLELMEIRKLSDNELQLHYKVLK